MSSSLPVQHFIYDTVLLGGMLMLKLLLATAVILELVAARGIPGEDTEVQLGNETTLPDLTETDHFLVNRQAGGEDVLPVLLPRRCRR